MTRATPIRLLLALFAVAILLSPLLWLIDTSLKTDATAMLAPPLWLPAPPTPASYGELADPNIDFYHFLFNSAVTAIATALVSTLFCALAAYGFTRRPVPAGRVLLLTILASQMFPSVVLVLAIYDLYRRLNLLNSSLGLVLAYMTITIPFAVWLLRGFFAAVPAEIKEAAQVDGASPFRVFRQISLPLVRPGLIAAGTFSFLEAWNNLVFPLSLVSKRAVLTAPPGLLLAFFGQFKSDWAGLMAASVVMSIPAILLFALVQRFLVGGLAAGAVRG